MDGVRPCVQPSLAQAEGGEVLGALARTNARPVPGTRAAGCFTTAGGGVNLTATGTTVVGAAFRSEKRNPQ